MTNVFINSPLQALCTYEALNYYKIEDYCIYLVPSNVERNIIYLTEDILRSLGLKYYSLCFETYTQVISYKGFKKKVDTTIVGDYRSASMRLLAMKSLYKHGRVIYVDDGAASIGLFSTKHPFLKMGCRVMLKMIYPYIGYLHKRPQQEYFTMFEARDQRFTITQNTLAHVTNYFSTNNGNGTKEGLFILGTKYNCFFKVSEYLDFLKKILNDLDYKKYTYVYYCPHRGELNDPDVVAFCKIMGVEYYVTKGCVEVDFLTNNVRPKKIVSFGSTASYTLKNIYSNAESIVYMIPYDKMKKCDADDYRIVYKDMSEHNITIKTV